VVSFFIYVSGLESISTPRSSSVAIPIFLADFFSHIDLMLPE